jgi:hypothetical protein
VSQTAAFASLRKNLEGNFLKEFIHTHKVTQLKNTQANAGATANEHRKP